jgi:hypothetical protein
MKLPVKSLEKEYRKKYRRYIRLGIKIYCSITRHGLYNVPVYSIGNKYAYTLIGQICLDSIILYR